METGIYKTLENETFNKINHKLMSRYISKLPEPIRALAEKRRSEYNPKTDSNELDEAFIWDETPERHTFWSKINDGNYSVFYDLYPQRDKICTCNSRTVDETFSNVIHSDECELSGNTHDKLDELIEWMEDAIKSCEQQNKIFNETEMELSAHCSGAMATAYKQAIIKAKEIKSK